MEGSAVLPRIPRTPLAHCLSARGGRAGQLLRPGESVGRACGTIHHIRHLERHLRLSLRAPTTGRMRICQLPIGVLLDSFGVRRVGRISSFLWSVASFAAAVTPNLAGFFAARLLLGIGEAPTFPVECKGRRLLVSSQGTEPGHCHLRQRGQICFRHRRAVHWRAAAQGWLALEFCGYRLPQLALLSALLCRLPRPQR